MVSLVPHDPPYFAPDAVPSRLQPSIRERLMRAAFFTMLGTSSTQRNSRFTIPGNTFNFNLEGPLTWALRYLGQRIGLIRDMRASGDPVAGQYHFGYPGSTLRQIIDAHHAEAAVDACSKAPGKGCLVIQAPRNDLPLVGAATSMDRVREVIAMCRAKGVPFILMQDPPRLAGTGEAGYLVERLAYNAAIVAEAAAYNVGCVMCGNVSEDPGNPGYADPTLYDNVAPGHMLPPTAERVGRMLANIMLARLLMPAPINLMDWIDSPQNLLGATSYMTGSGGTGGMPNGWLKGVPGNATAPQDPSVDFGDGTGRKWTQFTVSGGNTNARGVEITNNPALSTGWATGDTFVSLMLYRFPSGASWAGGGCDCQGLCANSFRTGFDGNFYTPPANPPAVFDRPSEILTLRSMPVQIPASNVPYFKARFTGTGVVQFGSPMLLKNPSTLPGWRDHWEYNP